MGVAAEAKKVEAKDLPILQPDQKSILLLRPGTVANVDRARSLIILQKPTKNVQELAKEEGEESEAKLREAIEISEGAVFAMAGSWRDPQRATSQEY